MRKYGVRFFVLLLILVPAFASADNVVEKSRSDISLKNEVQNAIGRGLGYLASQQKQSGWWSQEEHPALTALVLTAFQGDPSGYYKKKYAKPIDDGYTYILGYIKPDGGIYGISMANYNTSISVMALLVANRPQFENAIKNARNYLVSLQDDQGEKGMGDSPFDGGIGYGGTYKHSDLSNTMSSLEAIYYTRYLKNDADRDSMMKDLDWKAALQFISRTQNLPGHNDQAWASDDSDNRGGFIYFPGDSKADEVKLPNGKVALRSYGSMSYAGLLSYIYAQLDKKDPRVRAVYDWLIRHYTLEENPGMGKDGLYYYYHTMAKGLNAYGVDSLSLKDGKVIKWRAELAKQLLNLQNNEGFWVNESGRWWEKDPVLVTSYAIITLEIIWRGL